MIKIAYAAKAAAKSFRSPAEMILALNAIVFGASICALCRHVCNMTAFQNALFWLSSSQIVCNVNVKVGSTNNTDGIAFSCLLLRPTWDWTALPLFTPFVGPDSSSRYYGRCFLHLGAAATQG